MTRFAAFAGITVLVVSVAARGDGVTQPLLSPEDVGTDAFLARYAARFDVGSTYVSAPAGTTYVDELQASFGPFATTLSDWGMRLRWTDIDVSDSDHHAGPFTFALQHYIDLQPLDGAPLLDVHFGIEGVISTPWLSSREQTPPAALTELGIDTELANNGWSFRPSGYGRVDFVGCRNVYLEVGVSPEVFVPTTVAGSNLATIRYRAAAGADFGCDHRDMPQIARPGIVVEYRGRGIVYDGSAAPSYDQRLDVGVQWVLGRVTMVGSYGFDPCCSFDRYTIGVHAQIGLGGIR